MPKAVAPKKKRFYVSFTCSVKMKRYLEREKAKTSQSEFIREAIYEIFESAERHSTLVREHDVQFRKGKPPVKRRDIKR